MVDPTEENEPKEPGKQKLPEMRFSGIVEVCKSNIWDTIAYVVLAISLFYTFFSPFFGGLIVGFILGLYFSPHIFLIAGRFREFLIAEGIFKSFMLIAALVAFFISAPGMGLGLLLGSFTRPIFGSMSTSEKTPPEGSDITPLEK